MKKRFKLKKAFSTMLVSYIAILMIPAALAIGLSLTANRLSAQRCIDDTLNDIQQGQLLFENQLEVMDSNAMYLTYDYALKWILQMKPLSPGDKNVYSISEFHDRLKDIFSDSSTFQSFSVLLKNEYVFNESTVAQGREFYYTYSRNYERMDFEEYKKRSFYTQGRSLFPLQPVKVSRDNFLALTYNYPIISSAKATGEADAVVQVLIPEEVLKGYFLPLMKLEGCQVLLLDGEGQRLAVLGGEGEEDVTFDFHEMDSPFGSIVAENSEENALVVYNKSEKNDLIFAAALPEAVVLKDAKALKSVSLMMMMAGMLFELALGVYFAWKYSTPIRNLMHNVQMMMNTDALEGAENKSEYEHLESSIHQIIKSNQTMQSTLMEKQEKERKNFLNYLFSGEFKENEDIIREGSLIGIRFDDSFYCVAAFLVKDAKAAASCLRAGQWNHLMAVHEGRRGNVFALFGYDQEAEAGELSELVTQMAEELDEHIGSGLTDLDSIAIAKMGTRVGIGRMYSNEKDIAFSYMQSLYSITSPKDPGMERVVFYTDISQDFNSLCYPQDLEERLINSTKHGENRQIQQIFSYIREENIEKRYLSRPMGRVLASNIAATLMKVYNDIIPNEQVDQMVDEVTRRADLPEALALLEEQFIRISEALARSRNEREENYHQRLKAYVEKHYSDPQLCVAMAAEEFTLSESYFSQFFKDVMKDSFSSYLENVRLNKAKNLIDEGSYDLEQVAKMVGYHNSGTFRRAFKRVTGVSPSIWRGRNSQT